MINMSFIDHEYLPSHQQAALFSEMNTSMKSCQYEDEQEKCPQYKETDSRPGHVNLTCIHWRPDYLGEDTGICDAPWLVQGKYLK